MMQCAKKGRERCFENKEWQEAWAGWERGMKEKKERKEEKGLILVLSSVIVVIWRKYRELQYLFFKTLEMISYLRSTALFFLSGDCIPLR